MSPSSSDGRLTLEQVLARLEPILEGVIAPHAEAVDREGRFPAETVAPRSRRPPLDFRAKLGHAASPI